MAFANKSLSSTRQRYINKTCKAILILYILEMLHHYCCARVVDAIIDHKPLVVILEKDVSTLSQKWHCIMLEYTKTMCIYYTNQAATFTLQTGYQDRTTEKTKMKNWETWNWAFTWLDYIQDATWDNHLQVLKKTSLVRWLYTRNQFHQGIRPYWSFRDELAVIDVVAMKNRQTKYLLNCKNRH